MSFELRSETPLRKDIRRIVRKQLKKAVVDLEGEHQGSADIVVHEVRKRFKRIRAMLRLVRPGIPLGIYRAENRRIRDVARPFTLVRDAKILLETLDRLIDHFREHLVDQSFSDVRKALQTNLRKVRKEVLKKQKAFSTTTAIVRKTRKRVKSWIRISNAWSTVGCGLKQTYRKARKSFERSNEESTVERLHEWRKQVKYLCYQIEVLQPLWPERLKEVHDELDRMGEILGQDHDLAVLREAVGNEQKMIAQPAEQEMLISLMDRRRAELEDDVKQLGRRFFQERPKKFARPFETYWNAWHETQAPVAITGSAASSASYPK